jgi:hypothetical protein
MHSEVVAPDTGAVSFAELASAVKRINDPDAVGDQPTRIICRLFGEKAVFWSLVRE